MIVPQLSSRSRPAFGYKGRIRASNASRGISRSIRARNFSRRVTRFLASYSRSANVRCTIL